MDFLVTKGDWPLDLKQNELNKFDSVKGDFRKKSFSIVILGVLLLLGVLSGCNENKGDVKEVDISSYIDVKEVVLDNGLTVVVVPDPSASLVSVKTFVRAGSIDEQPFLGHGLSHYLEHVVAGGSTSVRTEDQYKEKISLLGGAFNAYTTTDHTSYYINTVPEFTLDAVDIAQKLNIKRKNAMKFDKEDYKRTTTVLNKSYMAMAMKKRNSEENYDDFLTHD